MAMTRSMMPKQLQGGKKGKKMHEMPPMDMSEGTHTDVMQDMMPAKAAKRGKPARNLRGR